VDDVAHEVEQLVAAGVKEINLISQDTIAYGRDTDPKQTLAQLVERVADIAGLEWLRLFYLYPEALDDGLIELLAKHPTVVPYVDMPLQHAADAMLRRMRRGHGGERLRRLVERLRSDVPDLTFRTAFIVGHPGETDAEFDELCEFVAWAEFERVGVFRYSDEESCASHELEGKVDDELAELRYAKLMAMSQRIARGKNAGLVGQTLQVLVEGASDEHEHVQMGRHPGQAPDIDGQVYLSGTEQLQRLPRAGELVRAAITQSSDYDLVGEVAGLSDERSPEPPSRRVSLKVLASDNRNLG
jgi:ribosomal protein S12 methylthiotransferase